MGTRAKSIAFALLLLAFPVAGAADFAKGLDALDRGDYGTALAELRPLAEMGNPRAQYRLGTMYAKGIGIPQDYKQGAEWLTKAATQGNADAQNDLGILYDLGLGVPADAKVAAGWFRKAAELGLGAAQLNLAQLYRDGRGVPPDRVEAFAWANAASERGEFRAQNLLDAVAKQMSSAQIVRAQQRAKQYSLKYVAPFHKY